MSDGKELAVMTAETAKAIALEVIQRHKDAISFVRAEELDTQGMFLAKVTVLQIAPGDFHVLGGGQVMPKKPHVDRMAEAGGVNITSVDVRGDGLYRATAKAHGWKRMPDGTKREGEAEYTFDAEIYAELDVAKDDKGRYKTEKAQRIHLLEYAKFKTQRASTGARLALIRFFLKTPTSYTREDIQKAMIVSRVDLNTDLLLSNPATAAAAVQVAMGSGGAVERIYGPRTERPALEAPAEAAEEALPAFDDDVPWPEAEDVTLRRKLQNYVDAEEYGILGTVVGKSGATARDQISELLAKEDATVEQLRGMDGRVRTYLEKIGGEV